jgi:hypothetical protein
MREIPLPDNQKNDLEYRTSVTELAECVKELVRITSVIYGSALPPPLANRLDDVYKKASAAKNRMDM